MVIIVYGLRRSDEESGEEPPERGELHGVAVVWYRLNPRLDFLDPTIRNILVSFQTAASLELDLKFKISARISPESQTILFV